MMTTLDKVYHKIKTRWNRQRTLMNADREELIFLVDLLDLIENEDDAVPPKKPGEVFAYVYACGNCEAHLDRDWIVCPWCGMEIKWNG